MSTAHYAYEHVTPDVFAEDMRFGDSAPEAGDGLPEFDLPTVDGGRLKSGDLAGRPVLLITGSFPCPMRPARTRPQGASR